MTRACARSSPKIGAHAPIAGVSGASCHYINRASYYAATDKARFHCYLIISECPALINGVVMDFDHKNIVQLRDATDAEVDVENKLYVGDAPFCFEALCARLNDLLPNGFSGENYGPLTMNCRTVAALTLLCAGFSRERVDAIFSDEGCASKSLCARRAISWQ